MSKLPDYVKLEISRGIEDLLKRLIDEVTCRERCTATPISPLMTNPKKLERHTTGTFLAPDQRGGNRCAFCMRPHRHVDCRKVVNQEMRRIVKRYGRCFVCPQKEYKASCRECTMNCSCGSRHHPALCENKERDRNGEGRVEGQVTENAPGSGPQGHDAASTLHVNSRAQVVLQTAQAMVSRSNLEEPQGFKIRVIFDAGWKCSLLTASCYCPNRCQDDKVKSGVRCVIES